MVGIVLTGWWGGEFSSTYGPNTRLSIIQAYSIPTLAYVQPIVDIKPVVLHICQMRKSIHI